MNPFITFPAASTPLKLVRPAAEKWAATLAEERQRLQEDLDALREREANLREYETRLRTWQTEIDAGRVAPMGSDPATPEPAKVQRRAKPAPVIDDPALQASWEKLHRARELLEAEQTHLRDDRMEMRDLKTAMRLREKELADREARVAEREATVVAAATADNSWAIPQAVRAPFDAARAGRGRPE